jgi:hypothetical protein
VVPRFPDDAEWSDGKLFFRGQKYPPGTPGQPRWLHWDRTNCYVRAHAIPVFPRGSCIKTLNLFERVCTVVLPRKGLLVYGTLKPT